MTATLLAIPILGSLLILQTAVFSQLPLLRGTTDLVMVAIIAWSLQKSVKTAWQWGIIGGLLVSLSTALPFGLPIIGYLLVVGMALLLRQRVWQVPILAMFVATFLGTLITQALAVIVLRFTGTPLAWLESVNMITLPSMLLNLVVAIPAYALLGDLARWLYPEELVV
jgi:rod shape-determining protein MreD